MNYTRDKVGLRVVLDFTPPNGCNIYHGDYRLPNNFIRNEFQFRFI